MDIKSLENFNQRGWIPGPNEDEASFLARIEALNYFFSNPPADVDHFLTDYDWEGARKKTGTLFGFSPDWIVAHYSNSNLSFFQGAATWISIQDDLRIPLIQLRNNFEKGRLLKVYSREEVLAHEAVHAARMQFDEPVFEEFFAYKTSPYLWRRLFGPIFQKTWEAYLFLTLIFIPLVLEIFDLEKFNPLSFLPLIFFGFLFLRLIFLHITLACGLKKLKSFLQNPNRKWAAALLLTDREIFQFAYFSNGRLKPFLQGKSGLRWVLLRDSYFKKR